VVNYEQRPAPGLFGSTTAEAAGGGGHRMNVQTHDGRTIENAQASVNRNDNFV